MKSLNTQNTANIKLQGSKNAHLPEDVQFQKPNPVMSALEDEFLQHEPDSPIIHTIWKTMILMSVSKKENTEFIRNIYTDPQHQSFLKAFVKFQIQELREVKGAPWNDGLEFKNEITSLSQDMIDRISLSDSQWTKRIYQNHGALLNGELRRICFSISFFPPKKF